MDHRTELSVALATSLIRFLTLITLGFVLWFFAKHNYWAVVFLLWAGVQAGFMWWQWAFGKARVLLPWFAVSIAAVLAFVVFAPVPATTVIMDVGKRSISAAVTLNDLDRKDVERGTSDPRALGWLDTDWLSRHALGLSRVTLYFGDALDDRTRDLEIRFGKYPARFNLRQMAIGSDILGVSYPLVTWSGKQIVDEKLFEPRQSKLTMLESGQVELLGPKTRPTLGVSVNRAQVVSSQSARRETGYRLIWALLFLIVPWAFLLAARSARKLDRTSRSIATWLAG